MTDVIQSYSYNICSQMSCTSPCVTCTASNFYSCLTCDSTISSNFSLNGSMCLNSPVWYIQLAATCCLFIFIIFPLLRKRSLVVTKILDIIQTAAYFKYIVGFIQYRQNYVYLDMRAMNPWNEGWQLVSIANDAVIPIFLTEQSFLNKLIRIGAIWCGIIVIVFLIGILKSMCGDSKLQFTTFMSKNMGNAAGIALNITIQDISFYCASVYYNVSFSNTMNVIFFIIALALTIFMAAMLLWQFSVINHKYEEEESDALYQYQMMFMYRMDYDLFQTFSLTNLPKHEKKIHRYSNLAMIDLIKKIGYAFLIVSYLYSLTADYYQQTYRLLGYIFFFQIIWYIALPFDPRKQAIQLMINILADLLLLALLIFPMVNNTSNYDFIIMVAALSLFGLALFSAFFQIFLDLYCFIPYDLYNIGLTVVIEDKQLLKQLARRKKQQQQNEKKIKALKEEQQKLLSDLRKKKGNQADENSQKDRENDRENDSEVSIDHKPERPVQHSQDIEDNTNDPNQFIYPVENNSNDDDELGKYRIDLKKKRRVYQFDKKKPFAYSNKAEL